jgi:two-component system cell cycle response regulator
MSHKILSIDDSKAVRMIIRRAFSTYDSTICEAANGEEGLAVAAAEKPDLILLDITMPTMDGITMLGLLKKDAALKDIPVVMLTAEHGQANVANIVSLGVRDYCVKPFEDEQIVAKVAAILPLAGRELQAAA